jgi:hypothetical protein
MFNSSLLNFIYLLLLALLPQTLPCYKLLKKHILFCTRIDCSLAT